MLKQLKKYDYDDLDDPLIWKQKEIFHELANKRFKEIIELDEKVNLNYLLYRNKSKNPDEKFGKYDKCFRSNR